MNKFTNDLLKALIMGVVVPAILLGAAVGLSGGTLSAPYEDAPATSDPVLEQRPTTIPTTPATRPTVPTTVPTQPEATQPSPDPGYEPITIKVIINGYRHYMELETYLLGVVLAEVPATFDEEALKAQAVAARTYTLRSCTNPSVHGGGICTRSSCCQAYVSPERYIINGGKYENLEKIRKAVEATAGLVLTYNGELILSTYFSCSGGSTENAIEVWGQNYPYLQSVDSPGEEGAEVYSQTLKFSGTSFAAALGLELTGDPSTWFGKTVYTEGGGVHTMTIGETVFKGTQLRTALGLRSTAFSISVSDGIIYIKTLGNGHRIGMSQYGADAMARNGSSFDEILLHYYSGVVIEQYVA